MIPSEPSKRIPNPWLIPRTADGDHSRWLMPNGYANGARLRGLSRVGEAVDGAVVCGNLGLEEEGGILELLGS